MFPFVRFLASTQELMAKRDNKSKGCHNLKCMVDLPVFTIELAPSNKINCYDKFLRTESFMFKSIAFLFDLLVDLHQSRDIAA